MPRQKEEGGRREDSSQGFFPPSPLFLYVQGMATQTMGVTWGKQCQKSLAHGNLGAAALERAGAG